MSIYSKALFFILLLSPSPGYGQDIGKWRAGSARKLDNSVYTVSCFISDSSGEWSYEEKFSILNKVTEATKWINQQAAKYNINIHFRNGSFGLTTDIKLPQIERGTASGNERVDLVSIVLAKIGYKSPIDLYNWVITNTKCENVEVILFAKGQGNGYSMAYSSDMSKALYFVEGAVLYEKYWNDYELASSSIVHEILHLYGAWDLYKTFQQSQENENRARKFFPDSIMLRTSFNIDELNIDEVTAWLIGWNNAPKDWYELFRPGGR